MVDVAASQGGAGLALSNLKLSDIINMLKRGDLALAFGVLTILVVLIMPLPSVVVASQPVRPSAGRMTGSGG